jgi:hypothetical protein
MNIVGPSITNASVSEVFFNEQLLIAQSSSACIPSVAARSHSLATHSPSVAARSPSVAAHNPSVALHSPSAATGDLLQWRCAVPP